MAGTALVSPPDKDNVPLVSKKQLNEKYKTWVSTLGLREGGTALIGPTEIDAICCHNGVLVNLVKEKCGTKRKNKLMFHKWVFLNLVSWMELLFSSCWFATTWHGGHVGGAIEVISQGERVQGWRSDESTHLPQMWPGFKSQRRRRTWVEFVVGSLPCSERFFSRYSSFPLSSKTNISKFQFDQESGRQRTTMWMCYLKIIIYLIFIYMKNRGFKMSWSRWPTLEK